MNEPLVRTGHTQRRTKTFALRAFGKPIVFWQFTVTLDEDDDENEERVDL